MAAHGAIAHRTSAVPRTGTGTEPAFVRWVLITVALAFLGLLPVVPLVSVFAQAFEKGVAAYAKSINESDAWAAIRLTLMTAAIAVPLNTLFGVCAAWAIAKFEFVGKQVLITL